MKKLRRGSENKEEENSLKSSTEQCQEVIIKSQFVLPLLGLSSAIFTRNSRVGHCHMVKALARSWKMKGSGI